jgi:enoyl-[acyl-carrier protein] reductase/trans-2-enoyl-CoA reductase (NAD+)
LFTECLYSESPRLDDEGRLRVDELELDPAIQDAVTQSWAAISNETLDQLTDLNGYKQEFLNLFGFEIEGVDYDADTNPDVPIDQMV